MAVRGRKPKSPELRVIQGVPKSGLAVASPLRPIPGDPMMPEYFDEEHAAKWHEVTEVMRGHGTLGLDVAETVRLYVEALVSGQRARAILRDTGDVIQSPQSGVDMHSPWRTVAKDAEAVALKLAIEMGFTPSSRGRIAKPAGAATTNRFLTHGLAVVG